MRTLVFPYVRFGAQFAPIIPVTIFSRNLVFKTEAYVDSGAFYSIFRSEMLETLRLDKGQGRLKMLKAADGENIPAYVFRLPLQVGDVKLRALVAFSDKLNVGFNLLGRQTVFGYFEEVAFNERARKVIFHLRK